MSLPLMVACTSVIWALFTTWTSSPTTLTSTLATVAMCSSALFYLYYHTRRRSNSSSTTPPPWAWMWGPRSLSTAPTSGQQLQQQQQPRFITLNFLSSTASTAASSTSTKSIAQPPFLISSNDNSNSNGTSSSNKSLGSTTMSGTTSARIYQHPQSTGEQTHKHSNDHLSPLSSTETTTTPTTTTIYAAAGAETTGVTSAQPRAAGLSALGTVSSETLDALRTHPDDRIWDHIIVGDGYEGLQSAHQLALMHPTRTILVLLQQDIQPNAVQTVVLWSQQRLTEQAQRLWTTEALQALPTLHGQHAPVQSTAKAGSLLDKSKPVDIQSLPANISIGSRLCATRILIDQPVSNPQPSSTTATETSTSPHPVMRLNSLCESQRNMLTIDTTPLAVSRAVGLEVKNMHDLRGPCLQLFCKTSIVIANHKHTLLHTLDTVTTPPTSSAWRRISSDTTEDPSHWPRMVFTIRMQYFQQKRTSPGQSEQSFHPLSTTAFRRLLSTTFTMLDRLAQGSKNGASNVILNKGLHLEPVILHQSNYVVQNGRVGLKSDDSDAEGTFNLEISASRSSLDVLKPIQLQINVLTQRMPNNTFGNTETIRNGEAVLLEGLAMARSMAHRAGWTCQEEDESEMIEWVRDKMDIQWLSETWTDADMLLPVCSTIDCIQKFRRARTFSNGSFRVRTPNLSPYASRTHSYHGKRKEDQGLGIQRDTLSRLQEVSANLKEHKDAQSDDADDFLHANDANGENDKGRSPRQVEENSASKVSIIAVESVAAKRPLKTSFGGFSSLNESRSQTLALAEMTEDHLGLALSAPSPPIGSSSSTGSKESTAQEKGLGVFSDGVTSHDLLGTTTEVAKPSPPGRSLSRFSIKSYQLERSNHGLGDEWALGNVDLSPSKNDFLVTPPLSAERRASGSVSPLSPSPATFQGIDFLQDLNGRSNPKVNTGLGLQSGSGVTAFEEPTKSSSQGSNTVDNSSRRSFGVFRPRSFGGTSNPGELGRSGSSGDNRGRKSPAQLLDDPVELVPDFLGSTFGSPKTVTPATFSEAVPDFLGASFGSPRSPSQPSIFATNAVPDFLGGSFGSPPKRGALAKLGDTDSPLERNHSSPSAIGSSKVVHFADLEATDKLRRIESDPITRSLDSSSGNDYGAEAEGTSRRSSGSSEGDGDSGLPRRPSLLGSHTSGSSISPNTSKSKAHTRRSWGQGIGGHDIQGLQGLE